MASNAEHVTLGGLVLGLSTLLVDAYRRLIKKEEKAESKKPTVREWKDARLEADQVADMQATLRRIETRLSEADLPGIVHSQAVQAAKLTSLEIGQVRLTNEVVDLRREAEERDDKLGRLTKRIEGMGK